MISPAIPRGILPRNPSDRLRNFLWDSFKNSYWGFPGKFSQNLLEFLQKFPSNSSRISSRHSKDSTRSSLQSKIYIFFRELSRVRTGIPLRSSSGIAPRIHWGFVPGASQGFSSRNPRHSFCNPSKDSYRNTSKNISRNCLRCCSRNSETCLGVSAGIPPRFCQEYPPEICPELLPGISQRHFSGNSSSLQGFLLRINQEFFKKFLQDTLQGYLQASEEIHPEFPLGISPWTPVEI